MQIRMADFSGIYGSINANNNADLYKARQEKENLYQIADAVDKITQVAQSAAIRAAAKKNAASDAKVKGQLADKASNLDSIIASSFASNSSSWDANSNTAIIGNEVKEYMDSALDDIEADPNITRSAKRKARQEWEAICSRVDDKIQGFSIQEDNKAIAQNINQAISSGLTSAINSGDFSIFENVVAGLPLSNNAKNSYLLQGRIDYEIRTIQENANKLATTEGADAAIKYIESGNYGEGFTVPLTREQKDSLSQKARNWDKQQSADLVKAVTDNAREAYNNGMTFTDIYKSNTDGEAYSASRQKEVDDAVAKVQAEECTKFYQELTSDITSVQDIDEALLKLEENKEMFTAKGSESGGQDQLYKTAKSTLEKMKTDAIDYKSKEVASSIKSQKESLLTLHQGNEITANVAESSLYSFVLDLTGDPKAASMECIDFMQKMDIPENYKQLMKSKTNGFKDYWLSRFNIDEKDMKDNPELVNAYSESFDYYLANLTDILINSAGKSESEVLKEVNLLDSQFIGKYQKANNLKERISKKSEFKDSLDLAAEIATQNPVMWDNSIKNIRWIGTIAEENFKDIGEYWRDTINNTFGMELTFEGPLVVRQNDRITDVLAIPVLRDSKTQDIYTINPDNGDLVNLTLSPTGKPQIWAYKDENNKKVNKFTDIREKKAEAAYKANNDYEKYRDLNYYDDPKYRLYRQYMDEGYSEAEAAQKAGY